MMKLRISLTKTPFPGTGDSLIYFVFSDTLEKDQHLAQLNTLSKGRVFGKMEQRSFKAGKKEILPIDMDGGYEQAILVGCGKKEELSQNLFVNRIGDAVRLLNGQKSKKMTLFIQKEMQEDIEKTGEAIAMSAMLTNYHFSKYKSHEKTEGPSEIEEITVGIEPSYSTNGNIDKLKNGFKKGEVLAEGVMFSRDLVNEPASHIYPVSLAEEAKRIAKESKGKISVKILNTNDCEKLGMGAYLGVAQGSDNEPKFIILHYQPKKLATKKKRICLIGKSVTFDTGGYQIKPDTYMNDMKMDMAGGAAMLGVFRTLADWDEKNFGSINYDVYAILPACENMISGRAFRPGDVLTAMNGKTIEVKHTDAEGRLTLADALAYAEQELKADVAIDMATLTGAVMVALGYEIAGAWGNDPKLVQTFISFAKEQGEEVWELPLPEFYKDHIKGDIADLNNLGKDRYGGAITAALFLQEFVGDMKWMHVDIAGTAFHEDQPRGILGKGATGWGVRSLIQILTSDSL